MVLCDYCGNPALKVTGAQVYPKLPRLANKVFWQCKPCSAYVGCHPGTDKPLGRLANRTLRIAKMDAHAAFDQLWKLYGMTRQGAYKWLQHEMGMDAESCHIGKMDVKQCRRVESLSHQRAKEIMDLKTGVN